MKYISKKASQISFPLGGIGTGCIGLSGNGSLIDVEIKNRPNKNSTAEFTHFAVKAETEHEVLDARVLQGDYPKDYIGCTERPLYTGYGFGPDRGTMAGFPHFEKVTFKGEFPIAQLQFKHAHFPGEITMEAFNPFIPTNEDDSSIPAAFFKVQIKNTTEKAIDYTLALSCNNYYCRTNTLHYYEEQDSIKLIHLSNTNDRNTTEYGDLTIATICPDVSYQNYWFRGRWFDNSSVFWQEFTSPGKLPTRNYENSRQNPDSNDTSDIATLAAHIKIQPSKIGTVFFVLSWSNPYINNHWKITHLGLTKEEIEFRRKQKWLNYYATIFKDSKESAIYSLKNFDRLYQNTLLYKKALFSSSLPAVVIDAISANIAVLKSPTCLRLSDGSFYAFEGVHAHMGSCEGTCTHVWSYAYALAFLFPRLERSARTNEYKYSMQKDGGMGFRLQLPLGIGPTNHRPAADGQFGTILRVYREFLISGDLNWLKSIWSQVKQSLEFAWSTQNTDLWDPDKTGILTGRQHHTLDMELFGPNSWLSSMYLAALKACVVMAEILGEPECAKEYNKIFERGKKELNQTLFNGEYFCQNIDLTNKELLARFNSGFSDHGADAVACYWNDEIGEIKYQIGNGCSVDQLLGQWHADLLHLGEIFEPSKLESSLKSIYKYNFIPNLREHVNPCRIYGLNSEQGTIICSYPPDRAKPKIPVPYAEETMHGYEYQAASHMIMHRHEKEGLTCVAAVRSRYDGKKRNPWNEMECGSNYARSLSSYALLLAYSGFIFDLYHHKIGFHPLITENYSFFWSVDSGFGTISKKNGKFLLKVLYGYLDLKELELDLSEIKEIKLNKKLLEFTISNGIIVLNKVIRVDANHTLRIKETFIE